MKLMLMAATAALLAAEPAAKKGSAADAERLRRIQTEQALVREKFARAEERELLPLVLEQNQVMEKLCNMLGIPKERIAAECEAEITVTGKGTEVEVRRKAVEAKEAK